MKTKAIGFIFSPDQQEVLLIHHADGTIGGVRGEVIGEPSEFNKPINVMIDAVLEQTGLKIPVQGWQYKGFYEGISKADPFVCYVYVTAGDLTKAVPETPPTEGQFPMIMSVGALLLHMDKLEPHLSWLVPMGLTMEVQNINTQVI